MFALAWYLFVAYITRFFFKNISSKLSCKFSSKQINFKFLFIFYLGEILNNNLDCKITHLYTTKKIKMITYVSENSYFFN